MATPQPGNAASPRFVPSASTPLPVSSIALSTSTPTAIPSSSLPSIPSAPHPAFAATTTTTSSLSHYILTSLSSLHLSLSTFRASVDTQLLQQSQRHEDVRRELRADVERAREEVRHESEQQRREEADERKRWKRDMRDRLTTAHKQLSQQQPITAGGGVVDEQRLRAVVDDRVAALTTQYERIIADLTHRIQQLESRPTLTHPTAVPPPASSIIHQPTALSVSLSPTPDASLSYPVRSLSPSQQPRGVLKKAVRFNEDVRQRMFTTTTPPHGDDEEKETNDDRDDSRQQRHHTKDAEDDEFDMFQTRSVSKGWSAAPLAVGDAAVVEMKVDREEVRESAAVSDVPRQQQQQAALHNEWTNLSTPTIEHAISAPAVEVKEEASLTSSSTTYSYETPDESPQQQQRQVRAEEVQQSHADSSSEDESEVEDEQGMDSTDDEPLDLTDLNAAADQSTLDTQPADVQQNHTAFQQELTSPTPHAAPNHPPTPHPTLSAYASAHTTAAAATTASSDSDNDSDDEAVVTRSEPPRSTLLSHLPPLSSLNGGSGGRYKSSLAIRSGRGAVSDAVVVGDSEAVQNILSGGRKKPLEEDEQKEEAETDGPLDTTVTTTTVTTAASAVAAGGLVRHGSGEDDEVDTEARGGWQLKASVDRVFGDSSITNTNNTKPLLNADSDDEDDMVVVRG